jgi:phytoene/squalene synthetase
VVAPRAQPSRAGRAPGGLVSEARRTTRRAERTFALACRLLPGEVRDDVYLLYLVFRALDDVVDTRLAPGAPAGAP